MKFGFVTCVQLGLSCIEAIYEVSGHLDLVVTLNDDQAINKSGRVYLDQFCKEKSIHLHKSSHINNLDCIQKIKDLKIDWLFIIGWSQIANANVLSSARKGVIGIHPTLLPVGRGRASIPWAILKGLDRTGVTMFKLDEGVDTGPVLEQITIPMNDKMHATGLYERVNVAHVDLIKKAFPKLKGDEVTLIEQDESKATEWPGRKPSDGQIDMGGSVFDAERLIRAVTKPYPGAFADIGDKRYLVWQAELVKSDSFDLNYSDQKLDFKDGSLIMTEFDLLK
jgi:methionyl-tRNA formyltransferase